MAIPASGANSWLLLNSTPVSFDPGTDNAAVDAKESGWNTIRLTTMGPEDPHILIDDDELEPVSYGLWKWRPKGFSGNYPLTIGWGNGNSVTTNILVAPGAISQSRYTAMLDEIQIISEDLLYQTHSPAGMDVQQRTFDPTRSPALREFEWIRQIFPELADVMSRMKRAPHKKLLVTEKEVFLHQVKRFSAEVLPIPGAWIKLPPNPAGNLRERGWLPQSWIVEEQVPSFDTNENRMVKRFLWNQLLPRVLRIREKVQTEIAIREAKLAVIRQRGWADTESGAIEELKQIIQQCTGFARECVSWGSEPFLKEAQALFTRIRPSQVLQKNPHYQRFYRVYLKFQTELGYSLDHNRSRARIGARRLAEIYEMWAMFKVTSAAISILQSKGYRVVGENRFFTLREDLFQVEVDRDATIDLVKGDDRIVIRYEPLYPSFMNRSTVEGIVVSANDQRTPDLAIELWRGERVRRVIVFDAKYRYDDHSEDNHYLAEDFAKMWDYSNVLKLKRSDSTRLREVVEAVYMVYPGGVIEHDLEQSTVGALTLVPEMDPTLMAQMVTAFRQIIERIAL
jgi:hypothetical protein